MNWTGKIRDWAVLPADYQETVDVDEDADATEILADGPDKSTWRSCLRFFGPGYMVAVGYMDPGNWATDIGGGARFEYQLLFVVLVSSLIATMFQILCIKLGVVTRKDLAQQCRDELPAGLSWLLYVLAEIAIMATDLAEVIGSAIGMNLLFGIPLIWGVMITALDVLVILKWWGRRYQKLYEAAVFLLVIAVAVCFGIQLGYTKPSFIGIMGGFVPTSQLVSNSDMLYIAVAILGATVMPHNLYLHASICQQRRLVDRENAPRKLTDGLGGNSPLAPSGNSLDELESNCNSSDSGHTAIGVVESREPLISPGALAIPLFSTNRTIMYSILDTVVALFFAFVINCTILIVGASAFFNQDNGEHDVEELQGAYFALKYYVGPAAATLFAVALLASGQASTVTGTMAGQIIMSGFLRLRVRPIIRRLGTRLCAVVPAIITILVSGESGMNGLLVFSQVILSLQLPFAIIPLVYFTSSPRIMAGGDISVPSGGQRFVNGWVVTLLATLAALLVTGLNGYLVVVEIVKLF